MNISKKIVIINSVPINGGDEALLKATINAIQDNIENVDISVLCNNPILYQKYLPNVKLHWDWEYSFFNADAGQVTLFFKIKRKFRFLLNRLFQLNYNHTFSKLLASKREQEVSDLFEKADLVICSAGGYFHDFYGFERRLATLEYIHTVFKKPYFIFYQSIGPFWKTQNYTRLHQVFANAKKVILREHFSLKHLQNIGYDCNNVVVSNDIAFYLNKDYGKPADLNRTLKKIALNFRAWTYEKESIETLDKAVGLCEKLLKSGYELSFISTCQGIHGYTDDTEYIYKVINRLEPQFKNHIRINNVKLSLEDFLLNVEQFDAYIGMRLHGAILSLIAGLPVLNIAYEDKSLGIFQSLKLEDCSFSYKEDKKTWLSKVDVFILNYSKYLEIIESTRKEAENIVTNDFKAFIING